MKQNYLNNLPLDEAKRLYLAHLRDAGFGAQTETAASADACGRVLCRAVYAKICSPHYNASAMDGIAVKASDTFGASERPSEVAPTRMEEGLTFSMKSVNALA